MSKNRETFQYLLFIFGDFRGKDKIIELIATQLSAFTDKNSYLKYNYGDYGIVMNFESQFSFLNLREHTHIILEKVAPQYFLMEHPKNLYAFMPPELKINLFDIHEENITTQQESEDDFFYNHTFLINPEEFLTEEQMEGLFNEIMSKATYPTDVKKDYPTVDELLEKIKENGLNSLTETEKQILDEYSKS